MLFVQIRKPTRVGFKYLENGEKVRVSKKSQAIIPKPKLERDYTFRDTGTVVLQTCYYLTLIIVFRSRSQGHPGGCGVEEDV